MKLLLDTHAFLWFILGDPRLHPYARSLIESPENERYLSIASLWEIVIKASIGKLTLPNPIDELVTEHVWGNAIDQLPIKTEHLVTLQGLPFHHKDPFDRMIISQAICEEFVILSADRNFSFYSAVLRWDAP